MNPPRPLLYILAATGAITSSAFSAQTIVASAEGPGALNSTLGGTSVFDFNSLSPGRIKNVKWTGVGVFDQLQINAADKWGGANGSNYSAQSHTAQVITTLTLTSNQAYFGFWWSGGDADNVITFYSGATIVCEFTTQNFLNQIASSSAYYGNPSPGTFNGMNPAQPYAFVNFFGMEGTTWNKITFTNTSNSGYETDNYTARVEPWGTLPGEQSPPTNSMTFVNGVVSTSIPEPSALALGALGALCLLRRKR